jgi:hypothetical protein
MLGEVLSADRGHRGPRVPCGRGHEALFAGYRDKSFDTVLGLVTVKRAWYHCAACGHGLAPRDAELGVAGQSMSPGLAAMNDRAAAAVPFAQAARLLDELAGARLTAKRVERAAEASGAAVAAAGRERARLTAARKLVPLPPAPLPDKLYAVIDGTGVPVTSRETTGRQGKGEDGRARTREVKLAVFFTQDKLGKDGYPARDRDSTSVIATFEPASVFADLVKAEGIRRGADHVRQFTVLGDGTGIRSGTSPPPSSPRDPGRGPVPRPRAPARPRPPAGVHAAGPQGRVARRPPGGPRLRLHRGHLQGRPRLPPGRREKRRARHRPGLLREQRPRMRYRWFRQCGLFVGSGVVEAACKTVVGQRLKQAGMHWTVNGADAIIALRCKEASSTWEAVCNTPHTQTRTA